MELWENNHCFFSIVDNLKVVAAAILLEDQMSSKNLWEETLLN